MAITKDCNRRAVASALIAFNLADLGATAEGAIQLPGGAIVTGGFVVVDEVFNAGTAATLKVGDSLDDDRYSPTPIDLKTLGVKELTITGYQTLTEADLKVLFAQTGTAATTGKARLYLEYAETKRSNWTQG